MLVWCGCIQMCVYVYMCGMGHRLLLIAVLGSTHSGTSTSHPHPHPKLLENLQQAKQ